MLGVCMGRALGLRGPCVGRVWGVRVACVGIAWGVCVLGNNKSRYRSLRFIIRIPW